jgi:hypothetical protein
MEIHRKAGTERVDLTTRQFGQRRVGRRQDRPHHPPTPTPSPTMTSKAMESTPKTAPGHRIAAFVRSPTTTDLHSKLDADDAGCMSPHCIPPQSYSSTTFSADPRFRVHSPMTPASNHPKPKSSEGTRTTPSGCGCVSPAHSPRPYDTAPEKPHGRKTYVGVIVYHVGGHALDGTT